MPCTMQCDCGKTMVLAKRGVTVDAKVEGRETFTTVKEVEGYWCESCTNAFISGTGQQKINEVRANLEESLRKSVARAKKARK